MHTKLAISIVTYNRAKHINEDLMCIAKPAKEKNISIYIYDGSTDRSTENVVKKYIENGNDHIQYFHYDENDTKKRVRDALLMPDADYIWFCGDKFTVLPKNYDLILKLLNRDIDFLVVYHKGLDGIRYFDNPVSCLDYSIVPLTCFGASIIKKKLIEGVNQRILDDYPAFGKMLLYISAINKENFSAITLHINMEDISIKSKFRTESISKGKMWDTWIKDWYDSILALPKRYSSVKKGLLNRMDVKMHFFDFESLLEQRNRKQFDIKKCIEYRRYVKAVVLMPYPIVFLIALLPSDVAGKLKSIVHKLKERMSRIE